MKKFLSFHGLGIFLSAVVLSSLLTAGIWWKVLIIGLVFIFQKVLEEFEHYSYLQWGREGLWFSKPEQDDELARNIWFSGVKMLMGAGILAVSLNYGKQLTIITGLTMLLIPIILIFLYFGRELFPPKEEMIAGLIRGWIGIVKRITTIFLAFNAIFLACLNFGTSYVWLSSFLALMLLFGMMINDLVGEVAFERRKTKKVVIIILSVLPFIIGIISTIYQFWGTIWNSVDAFWLWLFDASTPVCHAIADLLTNRIGGVSVWFILLSIIIVVVLVKIIRDISIREINDRIRAARQAQADKEEAEAKIVLEHNLKMIIYHLANDKPITKEYLVYLVKNQNHLEGFPIKKLICLNLERMFFTVSCVKEKIVWDHDLEDVLRMYNSWFKKAETSDDVLLLLTKAVTELYSSIQKYKEYYSFSAFEKMLKDATPSILAMAK